MNIDNLFSKIPDSIPEEIFEIILKTNNFKLERIISAGHATPQGEWYDQDTNELVILLSGSAGLLFKDDTEMIVMKPGDYLHLRYTYGMAAGTPNRWWGIDFEAITASIQ